MVSKTVVKDPLSLIETVVVLTAESEVSSMDDSAIAVVAVVEVDSVITLAVELSVASVEKLEEVSF